jgi:hypothetical protein
MSNQEFGSRKVRTPILGGNPWAAFPSLEAERDWREQIAQGSR